MSTVESKNIGKVVLDVKNISLSFGGVKALTDISFDVREHEVRAIIGPNGAGKSSMLNCINGVYTPQKGTISFMGQTFDHMDSHQVATMGIARTFQNLALFKGMNVIENLMTGRNLRIKSNILMQAFRIRLALALPKKKKCGTANLSSTSLIFWRFRRIAKRPWASCPTACKSGLTWAVRWRWSPKCCCWTNRWRA